LNTRYVNYTYSQEGYYIFQHPEEYIISKNIFCKLNSQNLTPIEFHEMDGDTVDLIPTIYTEKDQCNIFGLEDIRLYKFYDKVRFIATNRNFAPMHKNRMIIGDYCCKTLSYNNCKVIHPPTDTWCEKNWIPLIKDLGDGFQEEYFIYQWSPLKIGKIDYLNDQLNIIVTYTYTMNAPEFYRVRGSSIFIDNGEHLVGVVHFSEETIPRNYYHMLVSLEKDSFRPKSYSNFFHFQEIGIEFCTGFHIHESKYVFWISKMDRDAEMVAIDVENIPLCNKFI
jgi:hypothetical protein